MTVTETPTPTPTETYVEPPQQVQPAPVEPVQTVTIGDYCSNRGATATAAGGATAYCARLAGTDTYVWSLTPDVASNPHAQRGMPDTPSRGDICYDSSAIATDEQGSMLSCALAPGGTHLVWQ